MSKLAQNTVNLWDLADLCTPWCLHTVVTLGVADHLAGGATGIEELAAACGADPEVLHSVLSHLAGKGVFDEPAPGRFALTEAGQGLRDPALRIMLDLAGIGGRMAGAWSTLPTYVRTGRPGYQALFGRPFWEDLAAHPDLAASFDDLIGPVGHPPPDPEIPLAGGWDQVQTVVDVGGGTGAMLAGVLRTRPGVRGILVDLPPTVERAGPILAAAGVADRVTVAGQSFFDPLPAGADLYLLRNVLNDWPDEQTRQLLRRCAEAARRNGRVVVLGGVVPDGSAPELTIEKVLLGSRNNSLAEFQELAGAAGLVVHAVSEQPSGRFLVECGTA